MSADLKDPLIKRFSLYGFLKNQQYYEPFFLLVLQSKGLSYLQIGTLYAFREACINLMGIPAGFIADLYGRRSALVVCFAAYIMSFLGFALTASLPLLYASMFAFAIGESFRSGTHKAMIFHHLRLSGQESIKPLVYGLTRSWSKLGSALSSLISGILVLVTGSYSRIFLFSIPSYLINMINVGTYPKALEGEKNVSAPKQTFLSVLKTMMVETLHCVKQKDLRALFIQSAALQATAKSVKDYLQPLLATAMVGVVLTGPFAQLDTVRRSAVILAVVYFVINTMAAAASRQSHRFAYLMQKPLPVLWILMLLLGGLISLGSVGQGQFWGATLVATTGFLLLVLLENLWRPLFLDALDDVSDSKYGAAVLSVEAQFQSFGVMLCAPLVGYIVDRAGLAGVGYVVMGIAVLTGGFVWIKTLTPPTQPI